MINNQKISIIIPVFNIGKGISKLISKIPVFVDMIYLVDDLCPLKTGKKFQEINNNHKVKFIFNEISIYYLKMNHFGWFVYFFKIRNL